MDSIDGPEEKSSSLFGWVTAMNTENDATIETGVPAEPDAKPPAPELSVTFDEAINYAFQQNAIPTIKELCFRNDAAVRRDVKIRITTEPAFAPPHEVIVESVAASGEVRFSPIDLKLSHDFLDSLRERVTGWLKVEVVTGDVTVVSRTDQIRVLARNEWCGLVALPEILAAFVLPNDPAVMTILGRAAEILRERTGSASFNGYQDKSRKRAIDQVRAIYRAIAELRIRYISPPASFESTGQKVRFPADILQERFATCLDLSLLVAACCEQAGLHPLVMMHDGHAYAGCWLEGQTLSDAAIDDLQHLRKLKASDLITVFETTSLTHEGLTTLDDAERLAQQHLETKVPFRLGMDVRRARLAKIHPMPIPGVSTSPVPAAESQKADTGLGDRVVVEPLIIEAPAPKPVTRIDQWKSRLLDLSLRNRLINFKHAKATIPILSPDPDHVEDQIAGEVELRLYSKPNVMAEDDPRDAGTYTKQQRADALTEHLREEMKHNRLHTGLDKDEHSKRLTELFRSARTAIEENGTNTLYLAVGILEWRETAQSDRTLRAPLLLVPVELRRKSVLEGFSLKRIDEDARLNVTLMEMLRQSFQKQIAGLDPLPEDENGVNVARVLQIFREAVRDLPGWEVKSELWLGLFSFTKFLLWKDLSDRLDDLTNNSIVHHLVYEAGTPYECSYENFEAAKLDEKFAPQDVCCPRSADSSQLAAVVSAAAGHNFVLEGPPGTGKSQTITNIIAHCLAHGKKVLFVAEKRAALDVVHRRLRDIGLDPFCLELHSNKTGKTEVLAQFDQALKFGSPETSSDWSFRAGEVEKLRSKLNDYARALHRRYPCGLSVFHCLDYLIPRQDAPIAKLDGWDRPLETPADRLAHGRELARQLQERARPLLPIHRHPLALLGVTDWSPAWQDQAREVVQQALVDSQAAHEAAVAASNALQSPRPLSSRQDLLRLAAVAESLLAPEVVGAGFATTAWTQLGPDLDRWAAWAQERQQLRAKLAPHHVSANESTGSVACEEWTDEQATGIIDRTRRQEPELATATQAIAEFRKWLQAPATPSRFDHLALVSDLAEVLLSAPSLGAQFTSPDWNATAAEIDLWVALVRERQDIRGALAGFQEAVLLQLDLDGLAAKWQSSKNAWFLPRLLGTGAVRRRLKSARADGKSPIAETVEPTLEKALRLRELNRSLAGDRDRATQLLGTSWRGGEPSVEELQRVRAWGVEFHRRLNLVTNADTAWGTALRQVIADLLKDGPNALAAGTVGGARLTSYRDAVAKLNALWPSFSSEARLRTDTLENAEDFAGTVLSTMRGILVDVPRLRKLNADLAAAAPMASSCLGESWRAGEPSSDALKRAKAWGDKLHPRLVAIAASDPAWLPDLRQLLATWFSAGNTALAATSDVGQRLDRFSHALGQYETSFSALAQIAKLSRDPIDAAQDHLGAATKLAQGFIDKWSQVREWCAWLRARQDAAGAGLGSLATTLESNAARSHDIPGLFERSFRRILLNAAIAAESPLRDFFGTEHIGNIQHFRKVDEELQHLTCDLIRARLAAAIPREQQTHDVPKQEIGVIRKEISKKTRHIPVRKLISSIPNLLPRLKPCLLMSPLSVAQYLDTAQAGFDVVIFDEASQIPVWDAVGAIARGSQLVVVGDPKQLPPTNFFGSSEEEDSELTPLEHKDLESILDELLSNGLPHKRLAWHYRSRHESLITFSNRTYYENSLLTFPSPETAHGGVRFRHVADAIYDKGKSRTNRIEAEALVAELVSRLRGPASPARSYGVVTFSQAQQSLIENLLDEARSKYPEIEAHFGDEPPIEGEPVFVKNLENVQGDERDVIMFSICYGADQTGRVAMNFGPLNKEGGERRLNVAITRAKHEVVVFSGLRAGQIDLTRTRARGVRDLKNFLDFAERGPRAIAAATHTAADAEPESEFERMVAARIRAAGWEVHHQVGCSSYRVDLAVVDPAASGRYLLGIECDGATYHRAATARDRDKLRQAILEGLGWKLHRIWSTDWWHKREEETGKLLAHIKQLATPGPAAPATTSPTTTP